ncbi:MAG: hypothetical protein HY000_09300, partial [Planctomycetes bacterium]|nr:hypothetical protein [Planctomycetota bacterium]
MSTNVQTRTPDEDKIPRRDVLLSAAGVAGGLLAPEGSEALAADSRSKPSVYEAIGVKHVINAAGTLTTLGGSLMPP